MLMYCLITVNGLFSNNFVEKVRSLTEGVKDVFAVYGEYDFVITIEGVSVDKLHDIVEKIKGMQEVNSINSLFVTDKTRAQDIVY